MILILVKAAFYTYPQTFHNWYPSSTGISHGEIKQIQQRMEMCQFRDVSL